MKLPKLARVKATARRKANEGNPTLKNLYYRLVSWYQRAHLRGLRLRSSGLGGGEQVQGVNPENFVWIFCTARSGSTWLMSMLNELVEGEVWEEPRVGRLFGEFYSKAQQSQLASPNFVLGDPTREAWTGALRNFVLETAWASHPSVTPDQYLIVKEPGGAVGAPLLMDALPESRMVLLVRDPRDFAASLLDALKEGSWMYEAHNERKPEGVSQQRNVLRRLRTLSEQYVWQMSNGKKAFDAHRGHKVLVKYEELRADTLGTMRRLCQALAVPVDEQRLVGAVATHSWENVPAAEKGKGKFYRKATPGGWREDLTPKQASVVEDITMPLIKEFSYPVK